LSVNVYFLLPYARQTAPSQRFRIEAYYALLEDRNIRYKVGHFWSKNGALTLYQKGKVWQKSYYLAQGFARRCWQVLTRINEADYVVIHREAAPLGPPVFEWVIAKVFRKKIIYDFDDAIWIPTITASNILASSVKAFWKVKYICQWSHKVSGGNRFLCDWAGKYAPQVVYNPTCVDMKNRYKTLKDQQTNTVTIGWTGSHSTLKYLELIRTALEELEKEFDFEFLVICDKRPAWNLKSLRFMPWSEKTEISDLLEINIGIMPLEHDEWSEGKCGFKAIQYLALGIPAVATPVGVNKKIVQEGENGFLCETAADWKVALTKLLQNASLRESMGKAGREKMLREFSTQSNESNFLSLFS
jgi:glycosyltransferase involved in cell wall biosynthesis